MLYLLFNVVLLAPLEDICEFHTQAMFCYIFENNNSINNLFSTGKK